MTGTELAAALRTLGWSNVALAKRLGCTEGIVRRMVAGTRAIEPELAAWLQRAERWLERHPLPPLMSQRPR